MADFDAEIVKALDIAEKAGAAAIDALETRIGRLEAAVASGLRGVNRSIAELWRHRHTNGEPEPAGNGEKPGEPAPAKAGDKPAGNAEKPAGNGEKPPAGDKPPAGNGEKPVAPAKAAAEPGAKEPGQQQRPRHRMV